MKAIKLCKEIKLNIKSNIINKNNEVFNEEFNDKLNKDEKLEQETGHDLEDLMEETKCAPIRSPGKKKRSQSHPRACPDDDTRSPSNGKVQRVMILKTYSKSDQIDTNQHNPKPRISNEESAQAKVNDEKAGVETVSTARNEEVCKNELINQLKYEWNYNEKINNKLEEFKTSLSQPEQESRQPLGGELIGEAKNDPLEEIGEIQETPKEVIGQNMFTLSSVKFNKNQIDSKQTFEILEERTNAGTSKDEIYAEFNRGFDFDQINRYEQISCKNFDLVDVIKIK